MSDAGKTTLVLHGLANDNSVVRADVFARKLTALLSGLRAADKVVNGKICYDYMIDDLAKHSAAATVREKSRTKRVTSSSIRTYSEVANSVYNGRDVSKRFPSTLVHHIYNLTTGAERQFSHGEISFLANNVIRIDDFLMRQSRAAEMSYISKEEQLPARFFGGISFGSFDGEIQEIDARGSSTLLRGKLIPTGGSLEIDCVMNKDIIGEFLSKFQKRARVAGIVHYDASSPKPIRIDVTDIQLLNGGGDADLTRWRGAFSSALIDANESEW